MSRNSRPGAPLASISSALVCSPSAARAWSFSAGSTRRRRPKRAVELALKAEFPTVSLDLIYGLPDQSRVEWKADLEQALALKPHHLSCYQLTVHEATVFGRRRDRGQLREAEEDRAG